MSTLVKSRVRLEVPQGHIVDLAGLDRVRGFGDDMQIPKMRGELRLDSVRESAVGGVEVVSSGGSGGLLTGVGSGKSQVLVQPLYLGGALLNGLASPSEEMGVVLEGRRYFFNVALGRVGGQWGRWLVLRLGFSGMWWMRRVGLSIRML